MSNGSNIDKLYKKKVKPVKGEKDALYFIGDSSSDFIDFYVTDNQGNLIPIVTNDRVPPSEEELKIVDHKTDILTVGLYYYYGYKYEDASIKIIRVEKGNVANQQKAANITGNFTVTWGNRQTLTYN